MVNPRKPTNLKSISGTERKDRAEPTDTPKFRVLTEVPPAPDWLPNAHAVKEWDRLAPMLVANKLLTDAGLSVFGHLCSIHGKIAQLYAAGETPNGAMSAQLRGLSNDFGLTPISQGKVKSAPDDGKAGNAFAKLGLCKTSKTS
jgi:phage terminase small subunit